MSTRLIILAVVAGGLAAVLAFSRSSTTPAMKNASTPVPKLDPCAKLVTQQKISGEEPEELPSPEDFSLHVEVDQSSVKHRLIFTVSEDHGYYVDGLDIRFWWQDDGVPIDWQDSPYSFVYHMNNFIKANETFRDCITVSAPELARVGGAMGTGANWGAAVEDYTRVRVNNPDKLPCPANVDEHCR